MKKIKKMLAILPFTAFITVASFSQQTAPQKAEQSKPATQTLSSLSREQIKHKGDSVLAVINSSQRKAERKTANVKIDLVNDDAFASVIAANRIVVADFYIKGCAPCAAIAPFVEDMSAKYGSKIKVIRHNGDNNKEVTAKYGVERYPTVIIFKNGKEFARIQNGYNVLLELETNIDKALAS